MSDSLLPTVLYGVALLLLVVGVIKLLTTPRARSLPLEPRIARSMIWTFVILEVAVAIGLAGLWATGAGWIPGKIVAVVVYVAALVFVVIPTMRKITRHTSSADERAGR